MSVGALGRGITSINGLLSQLSRVGPQGPAKEAPGTRPPVESVKPLPSRPSFQQRYQQDSFEGSPRQKGGRGGGGLDLSGGGQGPASGGASGGGAQAQAQAQARANQEQGAALDPEQRGRQQREPVDVLEFPKDQAARKRPQKPQAQPQKASAPQQKPVAAPAPKKPMVRPPPKPGPGPAFKPVVVRGEVRMERQTPSERKAESPQMAEAGAAAQQMVQLSQKI